MESTSKCDVQLAALCGSPLTTPEHNSNANYNCRSGLEPPFEAATAYKRCPLERPRKRTDNSQQGIAKVATSSAMQSA